MPADPKPAEPVEREPHQHEPDIPPTADDPAECEVCRQLQAKHDLIRDLTQQRDAWKDHKLSDKEAQAISACVKALDPLAPTNHSYGSDTNSVSRVLAYLAERYGVTREPKFQRLIDGLTEALAHRQQSAPAPWQPYAPYPVTHPVGTSATAPNTPGMTY